MGRAGGEDVRGSNFSKAALVATLALAAACGPGDDGMPELANLQSTQKGQQRTLQKGQTNCQPSNSFLNWTIDDAESFQLYLTAIAASGSQTQIPTRSPVPGYWRVEWSAGGAGSNVAFIDATGSFSIPLHASSLIVTYVPSGAASADIILSAFVGAGAHATYPPPTYTVHLVLTPGTDQQVAIPPFARSVSIKAFPKAGAPDWSAFYYDANGVAIALCGDANPSALYIFNDDFMPATAQSIDVVDNAGGPVFEGFEIVFGLGI